MNKENLWAKFTEKEIENTMKIGEDYKKFIDNSKTERVCVLEIVKRAKEKGFKSLNEYKEVGSLKKGDKVYDINKNKVVSLFIIGEESIENGLNIIGSHLDSPRLDLKPNPLYEEFDIALGKTHYYGGIKKYQWLALPLAMYFTLTNKDGEKKYFQIGDNEEDPIFMISDLLPHLAKDQMAKKASEFISGEGLNIIMGNKKGDFKENPFKNNILNILKSHHNIEEDDFYFGEVQIVPAGKSKDLGIDRSMIAAYGHDDRVCAFTSLEAILNIENPKKTISTVFVDKEEVGSISNTGMESNYYENVLDEIIELLGGYGRLSIKRALSESRVLSADVMAAMDPNYPEVLEKNNACYLGRGVNISRYTGSRGKGGCNDANHEFLIELRDNFRKNDIKWQMGELGKVDQGGGGTIAFIIGHYNAEVVDCGVPVLSMHAPYEIVSKADLYMTIKAYEGFLRG